MTTEAILKELHEIRTERNGNFVKYDRDRYLRTREKALWGMVKVWYMQTYQPEAWGAHQKMEERERARIESQNKARTTLSLKKKTA